MKVSFIIQFSSLNTPTGLYFNDEESNPLIQDMTIRLVEQIKTIPIDKEIILVDGTGDYNGKDDPEITYLKGPQYYLERKLEHNFDWLNREYIRDYRQGTPAGHCQFCSLGFQAGIEVATGDYLILQHNDTQYMFDHYPADRVIVDAIEKLEGENYEYITVDKKHIKPNWKTHPDYLESIEYFADAYWFLCRKDFYKKHNIYVDWSRGDTNHLATIACERAGLKYLHLPGYYEDKQFRDEEFNNRMIKEYGLELWNKGKLHILNNRLFLLHVKGGTGLNRIKKAFHGISN